MARKDAISLLENIIAAQKVKTTSIDNLQDKLEELYLVLVEEKVILSLITADVIEKFGHLVSPEILQKSLIDR